MSRFIRIVDMEGAPRLVNVAHISVVRVLAKVCRVLMSDDYWFDTPTTFDEMARLLEPPVAPTAPPPGWTWGLPPAGTSGRQG